MNIDELNLTQVNSLWIDNNGHVLRVSKVVQDEVWADGEQYYGLKTSYVEGCDASHCGRWWHQVHTNEGGEFQEYHDEIRMFGTAGEIVAGEIFGWTRLS